MFKKKKQSDKQKLRGFFTDALENNRTAPPACPHFGSCGGCEFQNVPYAMQIETKRAALTFIANCVQQELHESPAPAPARALRLTQITDKLPAELVPSPRQFGYRQRMDYVLAFGQAGLRRANRHKQVVTLAACPLLGDKGFAVFQKALRLIRKAEIPDYDYIRHTGDLRYLVVRKSRNNQTLLSIVTKTEDNKTAVRHILQTLAANGDIASGHRLLAPGLGDVSFGEDKEWIGSPTIEEEMNSVRLKIGANTFFQSNPDVAEKAYAAIAGFVPPNGNVLDMYSGTASIAATLSRAARTVTAVENSPENTALAHENIAANNLKNVELVIQDSSEYLANLAATPNAAKPDVVVVNPPRPGVGDEGMRAVKTLAPSRLAYLSCNPFTLLRDLSMILDEYTLASLTVYDMFPQTRHFESLALLEKK